MGLHESKNLLKCLLYVDSVTYHYLDVITVIHI